VTNGHCYSGPFPNPIPSLRASLPFDRYQIVLLDDRDTETTFSGFQRNGWIVPATVQTLVRRHTQYTTRPSREARGVEKSWADGSAAFGARGTGMNSDIKEMIDFLR